MSDQGGGLPEGAEVKDLLSTDQPTKTSSTVAQQTPLTKGAKRLPVTT